MIMLILFLAVALAHLLILSQLQFTAWPELLSYPYLFANGFSLYKEMVVPYPAGLTWILASIFELFGYKIETLKIATWFLVLWIDFLILFILKKLKIGKIAYLLLAFFIILQPFLDGNMLWFDIVTGPFLLLSFLFSINFARFKKKRDIFLAGIFLGVAILIKQIAAVYLLGFILWYFLFYYQKGKFLRHLYSFTFGLIIPIGFFLIYLAPSGTVDDFWLWSTYYPLTEWSKFPGYVALEVNERSLKILALLFLPLLGLTLIKKFFEPIMTLTILFLAAAILAIYPRFSFFHFQPALSFLIILLAQIITLLGRKIRLYYFFFIVTCFAFVVYLLSRQTIFSNDVRFYGSSEKKLVKKIIQENTSNEKIFLLGPNSSIYALSNRLPPKPWVDTFGWYSEVPGVQEWVIEGFLKDPPKTIYRTTPLSGNWFDLGTYQPQKILAYIKNNYTIKETVDNIEVWVKR